MSAATSRIRAVRPPNGLCLHQLPEFKPFTRLGACTALHPRATTRTMYSDEPKYSPLPEKCILENASEGLNQTLLGLMSRKIELRFGTVMFAVLIQTASLVLILLMALKPHPQDPHSLGYYPAAEAIRYHQIVFTDEDRFKTMNEDVPSVETDQAWREAQEPVDGMIEASYDTGFDLSRLQPSITSAVDGKYHMYGLEVFHNLHCLDRVRQSFYPEHYFPNATSRQILHHREHCLNHIRQSLMCAGDVSLDRWYWDKEERHSYLLTDNTHVCRDFSMLSNWVKKHKYRPEDWMEERPQVSIQPERNSTRVGGVP